MQWGCSLGFGVLMSVYGVLYNCCSLSLCLVINVPAACSQRQSDWNNYNLLSAPETVAPPACNTINCIVTCYCTEWHCRLECCLLMKRVAQRDSLCPFNVAIKPKAAIHWSLPPFGIEEKERKKNYNWRVPMRRTFIRSLLERPEWTGRSFLPPANT